MDRELEKFLSRTGITPAHREEIQNRLDPTRPISHEEQLARFLNALDALYFQAEEARQLGQSWRNFLVGSAVWAFREDASTYEDRWRWFYGMNRKVNETSRNICAEPVAIEAALARRSTEIIGMVVVGNSRQEDDGSTPLTLPPCPHCRFLMKHHPLMRPHTIIVTAHPPGPETESISDVVHEIRTFEELLRDHGEL